MSEASRAGERYGERPEVAFEIEDTTLHWEWRTSNLSKRLSYYIKRCMGCDLCMVACPTEAISLGPVVEIAAGRIEDTPLIFIDEGKCSFCGICDSVCFFRAIALSYNGRPAEEIFSEVKGRHVLDEEKCLPCLLCEKVCQRQAISVELKVPKKEELVKYEGKAEARGSIRIDEQKCVFCGLCAELCDAITIVWTDPKAPDFKPAIAIRVDEDECDYCELCQKICPVEGAIEVVCEYSTPRVVEEPQIEGSISVNEEECICCGLCAVVCPVNAIKVEKPLEGEIILQNLHRCDPIGCVNCFNICPVNCIYPTGREDKIAVVEEVCVFCGACQNACPEDVIRVVRRSYRVEEKPEADLWRRGRRKAFNKLVGVVEKPTVYARAIEVEERPPAPLPRVEVGAWEVSPEAEEEVRKRVDSLIETLSVYENRLMLSFGKVEKVLEKADESGRGKA